MSARTSNRWPSATISILGEPRMVQKSPPGPNDVVRSHASVEAIEVAEQARREANAAGLEKEVVRDAADVHCQHLPRGNRPGRLLQVARNAERAGHIHDAAQGHDAQGRVGMDEPFGGLSHGPVAPGGDDQLAAVLHGCPSQLSGVPGSLCRLDQDIQPSLLQRLLEGIQGRRIGRQTQLVASARIDDQARRHRECRYVQPG